jgi:glutamate 5-kinase
MTILFRRIQPATRFHQKCRKEAPSSKTSMRPAYDVLGRGGIATKIKSAASLFCSKLW